MKKLYTSLNRTTAWSVARFAAAAICLTIALLGVAGTIFVSTAMPGHSNHPVAFYEQLPADRVLVTYTDNGATEVVPEAYISYETAGESAQMYVWEARPASSSNALAAVLLATFAAIIAVGVNHAKIENALDRVYAAANPPEYARSW